HDAGRDQRDVVDRRRDVAEPVQQLVGGNEVPALSDDRQSDVAHLLQELLRRQLDAEAGDPPQPVERPAGTAEPAPPPLPPPRPPHDATIGPRGGEVLSPAPPVECLSTTLRPIAPCRSIVSPLRIIASVRANVSAPSSPRK